MSTAPAVPPLTLQDLDREELLILFAERLMFPLPQSELWGARWTVLSRRAAEARDRANAAFQAFRAASEPLPAKAGIRKHLAWRKAQGEARLAQERADRAARRADAAQDRAWKALEASYGRSAP